MHVLQSRQLEPGLRGFHLGTPRRACPEVMEQYRHNPPPHLRLVQSLLGLHRLKKISQAFKVSVEASLQQDTRLVSLPK